MHEIDEKAKTFADLRTFSNLRNDNSSITVCESYLSKGRLLRSEHRVLVFCRSGLFWQHPWRQPEAWP